MGHRQFIMNSTPVFNKYKYKYKLAKEDQKYPPSVYGEIKMYIWPKSERCRPIQTREKTVISSGVSVPGVWASNRESIGIV